MLILESKWSRNESIEEEDQRIIRGFFFFRIICELLEEMPVERQGKMSKDKREREGGRKPELLYDKEQHYPRNTHTHTLARFAVKLKI